MRLVTSVYVCMYMLWTDWQPLTHLKPAGLFEAGWPISKPASGQISCEYGNHVCASMVHNAVAPMNTCICDEVVWKS